MGFELSRPAGGQLDHTETDATTSADNAQVQVSTGNFAQSADEEDPVNGEVTGASAYEEPVESAPPTDAPSATYPADGMARALVERALDGAAHQDDSLALILRRPVWVLGCALAGVAAAGTALGAKPLRVFLRLHLVQQASDG